MRQAHYLRGNKGCETLNRMIFVDTESDQTVDAKGWVHHTLRFGWACYVRRQKGGAWQAPQWVRFTSPEELWKFVDSHTAEKHRVSVWVHNGSFDYPILHFHSRLHVLGWKLKSACIKAPPIIMKWRRGPRTLVLLDTLNIWRMSLAELGRKVDMPKLERPAEWTDSEADDAYCKRDVEVILRAVTSWLDWLQRNDMGNFRPTVAGQAMTAFRHRYVQVPILIDDHEQALATARASYHGGRVEAFYIGAIRERVFLVDVNSMYPYVMTCHDFPLRLVSFLQNVTARDLAAYLKSYCGCAHVRVETTEPFVPVVIQGKLIFPVGRFDAYMSTPELRYALQHHHVVQIHELAIYEKGNPFREFMTDLYDRRLECVADARLMEAGHMKLLMNAFSGKWGQRGERWVRIGDAPIDEISFMPEIHARKRITRRTRKFAGIEQRMVTDIESFDSHPAIAAHITAYGRMVMWALMRQCPTKQYLYCDTDGMIVTCEGLDALRDRLSDTLLGGIKIVKTCEHLRIYGAKDYILDGEQVTKGIRKLAEEIEPGVYRQDQWLSIGGLLRKRMVNGPVHRRMVKTLRRVYDKGFIGRDGFVLPFHIGLGD